MTEPGIPYERVRLAGQNSFAPRNSSSLCECVRWCMSRGPRIGLQVVYRNTLELQLICKCCRRPYYPDKVWESEWDQLVLGAEKLAICSICEQSVPHIEGRRFPSREDSVTTAEWGTCWCTGCALFSENK